MLYWIWLSLSVTPGSSTFKNVLTKYSDAHEVYDLDEASLRRLVGSKSKDLEALLDKDLSQSRTVLEFCKSKGVGIVTYADDSYPQSLREIDSPPVLLYYRGNLPDFNSRVALAVVGTRRLSDYGRRNAFYMARDLSLSGAIIVSGMALGIDGVAHAGALSAEGVTVAVLGSGIDVCYPSQHRTLARSIVKAGCVLTEYPLGTKPEGKNFPIRNRIISGLSKGVVVIEGSERSGALITARAARNEGRAVYALPGNVGNKNSEASNLLIQNGARLVTAADDIVRDFDNPTKGLLNPFKLPIKDSVDMYSELTKYAVSCVSVDDSVFKPSRPKKRDANDKVQVSSNESIEVKPQVNPVDLQGFDKKALSVYKRIPLGEECSVESLATDGISLADVMTSLLKLEVARFVVLLPGDRVKRK